MKSPVAWLIVALALSVIAFSSTVYNAYPRFMRTPLDATLWGLLDSAVLLVCAGISGAYVLRHREVSDTARVVLWMLLVIGILWSFFFVLTLGL